MTAEEYLKRAIQYERLIRSKRQLIIHLMELSKYVSENSEANIIDLERQQAEEVDRYLSLVQEIRQTIEQVGDTRYIEILYRRYFCAETWETISLNTGYDLRWVYRLHKQALRAVDRIINTPL